MDHDEDTIALAPLALSDGAWALRREVLTRLIATQRVASAAALERLAAAVPTAARRAGTAQRAGGMVAVLRISGVLTPRGSFWSMLFGGGSGGLVDFREDFREAVNNPDVGAIVLDIDSPGGLISLVPETAAEIRDARGTKPIIAVADCMAASGAYWLAAQADEIVITPSGVVGSIGVYMVHYDWSGWNEQAGIDPTYISAGKYKVEGNEDEPLSDAARADWQQEVDLLYGMFVDAVAEGRGIGADEVISNYGEGRTMRAQPALDAGLVDRIDTLEAVIGGLLDSTAASAGAAARIGRAALLVSPTPAAAAPTVPPEEEPEEYEAQVEPDEDEPAPAPAPDPEDQPDNDEDEDEEDDDELVTPEARAAIAAVLIP